MFNWVPMHSSTEWLLCQDQKQPKDEKKSPNYWLLRIKMISFSSHGEMSERFKEPVLKTGDGATHRGFESHSLRQKKRQVLTCRFFNEIHPAGGWNHLRWWNPPFSRMKSPWRWVDLISSEAKPKISSALADFILASARISFSVRVRIHTQNCL